MGFTPLFSPLHFLPVFSASILSAKSSHSETGILEGTVVKVADADTVTVHEYPFWSRRKLPGSGNSVHSQGVYLSGKRNLSGRDEYEKEIRRQLVDWYDSGSGGIRGFRILPGKNNFDWS